MPNWCQNYVSVSHEDPEMMKKFEQGVKEGNLFETLVPLPTKDGEWDYGTAVEYWGTKWDVSNGDFYTEEDGMSGSGSFDTAWGPGIAAYDKLTELGFEVDATYLETGMSFAGHYSSEGGDECYEYNFDDENWRDDIDDDDVLEMLESEYESWKEWQDEMEDDEDEEDKPQDEA
jgi:hypothetical protein